MSKVIYPETEGIYSLVEASMMEPIKALKNASESCSLSIPSNFAYINYLRGLPKTLASFVKDANEVVSLAKEIDNNFMQVINNLNDKCSSLDDSLLKPRERLVK